MDAGMGTSGGVVTSDSSDIPVCPNEHCIRMRNNLAALSNLLGLANSQIAFQTSEIEALSAKFRMQENVVETLRLVLHTNMHRLDLYGKDVRFHNKETQCPDAESSLASQLQDSERSSSSETSRTLQESIVEVNCDEGEDDSFVTTSLVDDNEDGTEGEGGITCVTSSLLMRIERQGEAMELGDKVAVSCDGESTVSGEDSRTAQKETSDLVSRTRSMTLCVDDGQETTFTSDAAPNHMACKIETRESRSVESLQEADKLVAVRSAIKPYRGSGEDVFDKNGAGEEPDWEEWHPLQSRDIPEYVKNVPMMWRGEGVIIDVVTNSGDDLDSIDIDTGNLRFDVCMEQLFLRYGKPKLVIERMDPRIVERIYRKSGGNDFERSLTKKRSRAVAVKKHCKRRKVLPVLKVPSASPFKDVNEPRSWKCRIDDNSDKWGGFGLVKVATYEKFGEIGLKQVYNGSLRLIYALSEISLSQDVRLYECVVFSRDSSSDDNVFCFVKKSEKFWYYSDKDIVFKVDRKGDGVDATDVTFYMDDFEDYACKIEEVSMLKRLNKYLISINIGGGGCSDCFEICLKWS